MNRAGGFSNEAVFHRSTQHCWVDMKPLLVLIATILPAFSFAQNSVCSEKWLRQSQETCSLEAFQTEWANCLKANSQQAEIELKAAYIALVDDLVDPELLIRAQSSWEKFRSNECAYVLSGYACNTKEDLFANMCIGQISACKLPLTCQRVRQLQLHAEQHCNGCPARKSDTK